MGCLVVGGAGELVVEYLLGLSYGEQEMKGGRVSGRLDFRRARAAGVAKARLL